MLKKARKSHIGTRIMAWVLTCVMMLSLVGVVPEPIWASEEPVTSWDFTEGFSGQHIEGTVGEYNTLIVDATNGKLASNGGQSAQFNAGTILRVPVTGACDITVTAHGGQGQYALYTINGEAASTTEGSTTVSYTGEAGYVEVVSTGSAYIASITLTYKETADSEEPEEPAAITSWDFTTEFAGQAFEGNTGEYNTLIIDATNGKLSSNGGQSAQFNAGTILRVPVTGACDITVTAHGGQGQYALYTINGEAASTTEGSTTVSYTGDAGYVEIVSTGSAYIASINLTYKEVTEPEESETGSGSETESESESESESETESEPETEEGPVTYWDFTTGFAGMRFEGTMGEYNTLIVDATNGKLSSNGGQSAQFNAGTILKVPVVGPCDVIVTPHKGEAKYALYTINGEPASTTESTTTVTHTGGAGYVEIVSTGSAYIGSIELAYIEVEDTTHILDIGELSSFVGTTFEKVEYDVPGNDYFTFIGEAKLKIEENVQTFDESYTSTHRFNPGGGGDTSRRAVKFTTTGEATVKVYWIAGGDGREMHILDASGNIHAETAESSVKNSKYISTLQITAAGTYYLCGNDGSNYLYRVEVTEVGGLKQPTVNEVTAVQDEADTTGGTVNLTFTGTAGDDKTTYIVHASKDGGENWIKVDTVDGTQPGASLTINLNDEKFGFGTWMFRVVGANEVVAESSIVFAPKTYTLTGTYNEGLEDAAILTGLVFTATTASIYEVPEVVIDTENHTYSVVLEQGTKYAVSGVGVDEYDIITPAGVITYDADATLDIVFKKKVFYNITISLGSTPDLSEKSLVYKFTHADGAVYEFEAGEEIKLREGTYAVEIGGDFEQMAYVLKTGSTLTVAGDVNHAITFAEKTSWSFAVVPNAINGTTGWFYGIYVDATNGKLASNGDNCCAAVNAGTVLEVPVSGPCSITVTPHKGEAKYALYTINGVEASTTESSTTVEYTGEAGTIQIVATGTAYISGIAITYPAKDVEFVEQPVMPYVPETDTDAVTDSDTNDIPKGHVKDSLTVQPIGQKLTLSQAGGKFGEAFKDITSLGYYLFPITSDDNKLEFDVVITDSRDTGSNAGFLAGVFTDNHVYTLGLRGGIKVRGLYSKSVTGFVGAGSPAEENIGLNREVHYVITMADTRPTVTITFVDDEGVKQTRSWSQNPVAEPDGALPTEFYYGFMLANVDATITNMVYTSGDGKTVYYDQNDCYYTEGSAPVASGVTAVGAETREYIDITWTGTVPEYDGTYVVEMQKDGGEWVELTQDVTGFSYRYVLPVGDGGNYLFRVCGQLGKESLGGTRNDYVTMESTIYVKGALEKPVVNADVDAEGSIVLTWQEIANADYYMVYRYSSDEGVENAVCIAQVETNAYTDKNVEVDVPYYYYVKAIGVTDENESPFSTTVWTLVASEREGDYVYEDEATEIFITKKSYDTVFTNKAVLEGIVYGTGTLTAVVNNVVVKNLELEARDSFALELELVEGRNDVNLFFADQYGNITRETFNFVYLTNYDMVVDADYEGEDGAEVNGVPTYKTVQAAVDAADGSGRVVILVLAGSYEERLVVNTQNITLIGEDRENTLIHFYPGVLGAAYEAGGDMDKRCATYIQAGATGFTAENISFANDYVYATPDSKSNKSADAIRVEADQSVFVNVGFESVQDTLYMHSGKQYYYKCVIKGLVDFIYSGDAARSYFNDCEIIFVYESTKTSGYVCAPKTAEAATYGLTFNNCVITAEEGCAGTGYLLARPWGANAYITWINCYMGKVINEYEPYGDMSGNMHEDARFFEAGTYGPGYQINVDRRQISPEKAAEMISAAYLGWNPEVVAANLSADYVGTIETDRNNTAEAEPVEDEYLWTDGDDTGLPMFNMEGYAEAYGVIGGGLLLETSDNYYKVATAKEFLDALLAIKASGKASVIELTTDINLGCYEIENFSDYSDVIKAYKNQALTQPTLIESGVSQLQFNNVYNLTIYSKNGASIKHANITMKNSENIIIRNIKFDELWEWDEETHGDYDRNDWDYMTIDSNCNGIWIDHCTFYKAYDGIIDVKNPSYVSNVTISWCEFLAGSENDEFFNAMMEEIYDNPDDYPYYQELKEAGMTEEQVYAYAYFQKKTHLFGQDDTSVNAVGIRVTLANNYYKNTMDRMPRLRYGYTHVYNCIMDAQDILDVREAITNEDIAKKFVSNGAASTCDAQVLLENCFINGIMNALNSGNGSSPSGYINAINSLYYLNGIATELAPKCNTTGDTRTLITDAESFIAGLPYAGYALYNPAELYGILPNYAGAGKLELTVLQWEKTSYNADWAAPDVDCIHTFGDWAEVEAPSCEDTGLERHVCIACGHAETRDIPATGHSFTEYVSDNNATTEADGTKTAICDHEGCTETDTIVDEGSKLPVPVKTGWEKVDGIWYYYDAEGEVVTGWNKINGKWYLFNGEGAMQTGWLKDSVGWYYADADGNMATGWAKINSKWYYFNADGLMKTGWLKDAGKWYYLNADGDMATGWKAINGKWYNFGTDGIMKTNWLKDAGKWYYLNADGDMATGWKAINGKWYNFGTDGIMKTGWLKDGGAWYYLNADGDMATSWKAINGKWYYFNTDGKMHTGWKLLSGTWYYFNTDGDMHTGWKQINGTWYYFDVEGAMVTGKYTINGVVNTFTSDGAWIA